MPPSVCRQSPVPAWAPHTEVQPGVSPAAFREAASCNCPRPVRCKRLLLPALLFLSGDPTPRWLHTLTGLKDATQVQRKEANLWHMKWASRISGRLSLAPPQGTHVCLCGRLTSPQLFRSYHSNNTEFTTLTLHLMGCPGGSCAFKPFVLPSPRYVKQ